MMRLQVMSDNPLADFVELPEEYRPLCYSNLLPGVIKGALEMVSWVTVDPSCSLAPGLLVQRLMQRQVQRPVQRLSGVQ